jgi:hypothetical protein
LKKRLEELESIGLGSAPVVLQNENTNTLLTPLGCGRLDCWPADARLAVKGREFRGPGQNPDRTKTSVAAVLII